MCVYYLCKRNLKAFCLIIIVVCLIGNYYLDYNWSSIFVFRLTILQSFLRKNKSWLRRLSLLIFPGVVRLKVYIGEMMGSPTPSQLSTFGSKLDPVSLYGPPPFMQQRVGGSGVGLSTFQSSTGTPPSSLSSMMGGVSLMSAFPLAGNSLQQQQRTTQQARPPSAVSPSRAMFMGQHNLINQLSAASQGAMLNQLKHRPGNNPLQQGVFSATSNNFSRTLGDSSTAGLDWSDFPSLSSRSAQQNQMLTARNYVGMVSKPQQESQQEFQIQQEDFPALPGAQNPTSAATSSSSSSAQATTENSLKQSSSLGSYDQALKDSSSSSAVGVGLVSAVGGAMGSKLLQQQPIGSQQPQRGIQTHLDGTVTNVPAGMLTDQFGIVGLLSFMRAAEADPTLVPLTHGMDLTYLGLNLNSPENLYSTFQSPWSEMPCRPQDIDYHVPPEYLTNAFIRDKLAPIKFNKYQEDLLFYLFYVNPGDVVQLAAAAELYSRDWRYHKEERVWITRAPGMDPQTKTNLYERGTYVYFDIGSWRRVPKEFHLEYSKLEDRPQLPDLHPLQQHQLNKNNV